MATPESPSGGSSPPTSSPVGAAPQDSGAKKDSLNIVFTGHVDCGKSTILGHLLVLLGEVDEKITRRYERECKSQGKPTFHFAWVLDQSEEERRRGITLSVGQQSFDTPTKRVSALDAPGHIEFISAMISGAAQADVGVLVLSAVPGEFEAGLAHGTKEHLWVLRILGVTKLLIAMNKMDVVEFSQQRFDQVLKELKPVLKQTRFSDSDVIAVCPVSGLTGSNLVATDTASMPWYSGPSLVQIIDEVVPSKRLLQHPLRFVVHDVNGRTLIGKVEAGSVKEGDTLHFVPSGCKIAVKSIAKLGAKEMAASAGDSVEITARADFVGISIGNVGCPPQQLCTVATEFEATVQTFSSLKNAILPGSKFIISIQALTISAKIEQLVSIRQSNGTWTPIGMFVKCVPKESMATVLFKVENPIAMELGEAVRSLGRFVLRQGGDTVGGGIVMQVHPHGQPRLVRLE